MKYRVVFHALADQALVELWTRSSQRERVTQAVDWLEEQLAARPHEVGESRTANDRIVFERPVGMKFPIDDVKQEVLVVEVWEIKKRGG